MRRSRREDRLGEVLPLGRLVEHVLAVDLLAGVLQVVGGRGDRCGGDGRDGRLTSGHGTPWLRLAVTVAGRPRGRAGACRSSSPARDGSGPESLRALDEPREPSMARAVDPGLAGTAECSQPIPPAMLRTGYDRVLRWIARCPRAGASAPVARSAGAGDAACRRVGRPAAPPRGRRAAARTPARRPRSGRPAARATGGRRGPGGPRPGAAAARTRSRSRRSGERTPPTRSPAPGPSSRSAACSRRSRAARRRSRCPRASRTRRGPARPARGRRRWASRRRSSRRTGTAARAGSPSRRVARWRSSWRATSRPGTANSANGKPGRRVGHRDRAGPQRLARLRRGSRRPAPARSRSGGTCSRRPSAGR